MGINWKVRIKNKAFWVLFVPAVLLLVQQICSVFGVTIDVSGISDQLLEVVKTAFLILGLLGVVVDPTTSGLSDSTQAMTYNTPKKD